MTLNILNNKKKMGKLSLVFSVLLYLTVKTLRTNSLRGDLLGMINCGKVTRQCIVNKSYLARFVRQKRVVFFFQVGEWVVS